MSYSNFHSKPSLQLVPARWTIQEILIKLASLMPFGFAQDGLRQTKHERNQLFAVRPEPVEGLLQKLLNALVIAIVLLAPTCGESPPPSLHYLGVSSTSDDCEHIKVRLSSKHGKTWVSLLETGSMPLDYHLYAWVTSKTDTQRQGLSLDGSGEPRYLAPLENGWFFLIAAPNEIQSLANHRIAAPPEEDDSKGAGFGDGPMPSWLESDPAPPDVPADAWVCKVEW